MFILTAFAYPAVLALLCTGAGLLGDRLSGRFLPGSLLPAVGAAALIAVSQLTTYLSATAPATPYVIAAIGLAGLALGFDRLRMLARGWPQRCWLLAAPVLAYVVALAPVLFAGRPTFSSYLALADSAVHMIGADYLIHHGQHYAHLDLRNSYGQFINDYYNTSYPSGSDTLFGGSALLLRLPLIWAFQPFNAFMLALAACPAWLLARRIGLNGGWATLAALSVTVPALVYGYELVGSIKEITALTMIMTMGALVVVHPRWLRMGPARVIPFALVVAGGVSALGVGFGPWVLAAAAVLVVVLAGDLRARRQSPWGALRLVGLGAIVTLIAAWPTWIDFSGSLRVAQAIASTSNPGDLRVPLRATQLFGTWLGGSYRVLPTARNLTLTYALVAVTGVAVVLGAFYIVRTRRYALACWLALMVAAWLGVHNFGTTWVDAKSLMLTSPAVVLVAWGAVAMLRASKLRAVFGTAALLLALALAGGALASDAIQYHSSNLAPTARYEEMASLNSRFAGKGPALFTDFDEYAMYELRNLDVGGPDFIYPPAALQSAAGGHGDYVDLDRVAPAALRGYPLIVTRRDPSASPPPSAYSLLWQGTYYQVWGRRPGAPSALVHVALPHSLPAQCARIRRLAQVARSRGARLVAARAPELVRIDVRRSRHSSGWTHGRVGLILWRPGQLSAAFRLPHAGPWELWLQGEFMPALHVSIDGHPIGVVVAQVGGNSLNPDTTAPLSVRLSAGPHHLVITRRDASLAPGDGGSAVLDAIFLTPARAPARETLTAVAARWRTLCGRELDWIELVPG